MDKRWRTAAEQSAIESLDARPQSCPALQSPQRILTTRCGGATVQPVGTRWGHVLRPTAALGFLFCVCLLTSGFVSNSFDGVGRSEGASGQITANMSPTPSPSYSRITVNFLRDGQPVELSLGQLNPGVVANGRSCGRPGLAQGATVNHVTVVWPDPTCDSKLPTQIELSFTAFDLPGSVRFSVQLTWEGVDVVKDIDVGFLFGSSTPTAKGLPNTGGPPAPAQDLPPAALILSATALLGGCLWALGRSR